jgi:hypothetical protein
MQDYGLEKYVAGAAVVLLALVGLFMARLAADAVFHYTGLALFLFMVLFGFRLIARYTGTKSGVA